MGSSSLKREILGIALLLFSVFLVGAFVALALAQRAPVSIEASVGVVGRILANPLVWFFGWPAAVLIPLVPAVHALRLFGRLESQTDRSWMIFFAGVVVLLPVALALAIAPPPPGLPSLGAGLWGEFVASWWRGWFGSFGAWIVVALAASVLMAATL
ncbi:MAG: DNA translocase FtsK 4TM domain-containing protein, partial [Deltaproteobacteria bacterium]